MMTASLAFSTAPSHDAAPLGARLVRALKSEVKFALAIYPLLGLAGVVFILVSSVALPGLIRFDNVPPLTPAQPTIPVPKLAPLLEPIDADPLLNDTVQMVDTIREPGGSHDGVIIPAITVSTLEPPQISAAVQAPSFRVAADVPLPQDNLNRNRIGNQMTGSTQGDRPVGAIVGGTIGAATGTIGGILGVEDRPRFRSYVRERNVRSYDYDGRVAVGSVLPDSGVTYYDVPSEYSVTRGTRYTVVNDHPVIVNQRNRIIEVIE